MKNKLKDLKNRIVENFKKNKAVTIALMVLWVVAVVFTLSSNKNTLGKISSGNEFYDNVIELCDGLTVEEVLDTEEGIEAIAVKFATYARKNSGSFDVKILGADTEKIYNEKTVKVSSLQDNAFLIFPLSEKPDPAVDSKIKVILSSQSPTGQGAGVYYSNLKAFEGSDFRIAGEVMDGDLSVRFLNESEELKLFYHIVIVWVITTFTMILLLILLVRPKYEILFTVIAVCFGLTFWLIITPMSVPDETIHYEYSLQLSNKMMGSKNHLIIDETYQDYDAMAGHLNISASYERFIKKINRPLKLKGKLIKMNYDINESYTICFIPQALGITLARLLKWNMLRTFYLGRLFNLIFYVGCVYTAVKKTPVHKVLFGIMATLPIFMQQAASFSYDCYINGLTFVIIAFLLKWMCEEGPIERNDFILAFIANAMISPIKVVYALFSFLYWFVPQERFGSRKNKIIGTLILTAPAMFELTVLLFPLLFRIVRKIYENVFLKDVEAETVIGKSADLVISPEPTEGEIYTFSYVMNHPVEMIMMFLRTVRYNLKTWFYASFGRALSGNTLILPTYLVHATLALLIFASLRDEGYIGSLLFRGAILLLCVFAGIMMAGGMLVSWTEIDQEVIDAYGGPVIQGIQGRYFSPLLPYLFVCLNNKVIKISKRFDPYILYVFVLLVFEVIVYVLSYTFVN
ncbi:MAG: DUF2142 domain-containing protein [Erysipelotrichaceae bacterium]|nr:DUF2142 domain-containing protein [Erysipelotrichaceae bacterium]